MARPTNDPVGESSSQNPHDNHPFDLESPLDVNQPTIEHEDPRTLDGNESDPRRVSILQNPDHHDLEEIPLSEFLTRARESPDELFRDISAALVYQHEIRQSLRDQTAAQEQIIAQKDQAMMDLIEERDRFKHVAEYMDQRQRSSVSPEAEPRSKTLKLPDPPILTDGKNPRYDDWVSLIKRRFVILAQHYPTAEHQIAYVQTRLGGRALEHTSPRFQETSTRAYQTVDEIYLHLKSVFHDPNRVQAALDKFRDLQMKPTQKYHDFLATFSHQAGEAEVPPDTYKRELYNKLTPAIRSMTWKEYGDAAVTFESFSVFCANAAYTLQTNQARENRGTTPKASSTVPTKDSPAKSTSSKTDTSSSKKRLDDTEKAELLKEGKCFYCKEPGHIASSCPKIKIKTELKALEHSNPKKPTEDDVESGKGST
jgi:hypothetical protein